VTHSRKTIMQLLDDHGLNPSRALGQNFVSDANTVRRIARLAEVGPGDHVVEIGAGLGSLTLALTETGARVTAVELDRYVLPVLRDVLRNTDVDVVEGDALQLDWNRIVSAGERATVVANLPYNVGTAIVMKLLEDVPQVRRLVVMLQKEVGARLVAGVGDNAYGALSLKVRYYGTGRLLGYVPPTVFIPRPDVDSAIVEIVRHESEPVEVDIEAMFSLIRSGFGQRRKMLRRALGGLISDDVFERAGIAPTARAEELSLDDWARLTRSIRS
jgi:16S rRNA (adenine1518-N6/adenine1519-N6)-dimethyltransferase